MRHVTLTCKQHPQLRWSCKSLAYTPGKGYNGARSIFFSGEAILNPDGSPKRFADDSGTKCQTFVQEGFENYRVVYECQCPPSDLVLAPEDPWSALPLDEQRKLVDAD